MTTTKIVLFEMLLVKFTYVLNVVWQLYEMIIHKMSILYIFTIHIICAGC